MSSIHPFCPPIGAPPDSITRAGGEAGPDEDDQLNDEEPKVLRL